MTVQEGLIPHASVLLVGFALGLRHGVDPDHLSAIDGLARVHPGRWNGVGFAIGHGLVVTLFAVGIGHFLSGVFETLGPWLLMGIGLLNGWRALRPGALSQSNIRIVSSSPIILGMIFAAGFETASQLAALALANQHNAWVLGAVFSCGMILVDGIDGYMAAGTQRAAASGHPRTIAAARTLSVVVAISSIAIGVTEVSGHDLATVALPLGLSMFVLVTALRVWGARVARNVTVELRRTDYDSVGAVEDVN